MFPTGYHARIGTGTSIESHCAVAVASASRFLATPMIEPGPEPGPGPAGDDAPSSPPPLLPTPSPHQLAWHDRDLYAFFHFNRNTFTDMEWGHGDDPRSRSTELDARGPCRLRRRVGCTSPPGTHGESSP